MQSIVKTTEDLIKEKDNYISIDEIVNVLKSDESEEELRARIYTDLMIDGRFFFKDDKVNLSENFTLEEVNQIKSSYSIEKLLIEENKLEEETINLQTIIDAENEDDDHVVDVDDFIEDELGIIGLDDD